MFQCLARHSPKVVPFHRVEDIVCSRYLFVNVCRLVPGIWQFSQCNSVKPRRELPPAIVGFEIAPRIEQGILYGIFSVGAIAAAKPEEPEQRIPVPLGERTKGVFAAVSCLLN